MHRRAFLSTAAALIAAANMRPAFAKETFDMTQSNFADVNGGRIFYEVHGEGRPLILLHGGISATAGLGPTLPALARHRKVIAVHLQGHGRTPDRDRPLRYETMADDIAELVRGLGLGAVDLMGYSLGGGVALQTAIRHPSAVEKLVLVSVPMRHDGSYPEVLAAFDEMEANAPAISANLNASPLAQAYPDVEWEGLFRKIGELSKRPFDWSQDVAKLKAHTMLVFADADSIRLEHMIEFYRLLGGGQRDAGIDGSLRAAAHLAIIPGATHYDMTSKPMLAQAASTFLGV